MLDLAILLFFLGLLLVAVEIFVPSLGLLSLMAGACFIASITFAFQESRTWGFGFLGGTLIVVPILIVVAFKVLPVTPIGKRMILAGPDRTRAVRGADVSSAPRHGLLDREGVAATTLRPAGVVEIDGERVDVITEGEWVDAGTAVVVTEVEGNRVVVRARDGAATEEST